MAVQLDDESVASFVDEKKAANTVRRLGYEYMMPME